MHGKATLILTDKDTGRVVEQREEHNLVTNALNSIFAQPPTLAYYSESRRVFNGYLPMYENLLKGLILFGDAIPENAYDYMPDGKYSVLATAGTAYSGTDTMRGTLNESQSCEIENGYRFVWDFAPEKAIGTIRCLALTSCFNGNRGNLALAGSASPYIMNPSDLGNSSNNNSVPLVKGSGTFFLQKGRNTFYSISAKSSNVALIKKYKVADPLALKICDKTDAYLESETEITTANRIDSTYSVQFYDPITERLFLGYLDEYSQNSTYYHRFKYTLIDPITCEIISQSADWIITNASRGNKYSVGYYNGKLYFGTYGPKIAVCSLSGTLERTIDPGLYELNKFLLIDGKIAVDCKLTSAGRRCIYFLDEPKTQLVQQDNTTQVLIHSTELTAPFQYATYGQGVCIMLRTDYLATINNLASPLVKTDRHALQVRYEITN